MVEFGNLKEFCVTEELIDRQVLDETINDQGRKLMSFMGDCKMCIVNGSVTKDLNDFTSVTDYRGRSVVDYVIVRQLDMQNVKEMSVISCAEATARYKWEKLLDDYCHLPDHNLLHVKLEMSAIVHENLIHSDKNLGSKSVKRTKVYRKLGESYMTSATAVRILPILMNDLEQIEKSQNDINACYNELTKFILAEAERSLGNRAQKRKGTKYKEYWDDELSRKWKLMHEAEFEYRKSCRNRDNTSQMKRAVFRSRRMEFHNCLRNKKRALLS